MTDNTPTPFSVPAASAAAAPVPAAPAEPAPAPAAAPGTLSELLKAPDRYALGIVGGGDLVPRIAAALAAAAAGAALFFFASGFFADWQTALLDAAKGAGIALFAFALCLPSLYVFSCVSGATLRAGQIVSAGAACLATAGLLLAALAPVLWLFAVSSSSPGFVTTLAVLLAVPAAWFAVRPALGLMRAGGVRSTAGLRLWLAVLAVVALQTVTLLRPMLAPSAPSGKDAEGAPAARKTAPSAPEKMFFLEHFVRTLDSSPAARR